MDLHAGHAQLAGDPADREPYGAHGAYLLFHQHIITLTLRPDLDVEGITLIVNHQTNLHPSDRAAEVYTRTEFVQSLTIPVASTLEFFHAWRRGDLAAIRAAIFGNPPPT